MVGLFLVWVAAASKVERLTDDHRIRKLTRKAPLEEWSVGWRVESLKWV